VNVSAVIDISCRVTSSRALMTINHSVSRCPSQVKYKLTPYGHAVIALAIFGALSSRRSISSNNNGVGTTLNLLSDASCGAFDIPFSTYAYSAPRL